MNRSVSRRYRDVDGTWVTVTERSGTRRRSTRTANYLLGPANYKSTTTIRRYADGTRVTERNEHHPWWAVLSVLIVIGLLVEGFGSRQWYWVVASIIVTALIVLGVVGAVGERISGSSGKLSGARREKADADPNLVAALNMSTAAVSRATKAMQSGEWQLARAAIEEARRAYSPVQAGIADGRIKGREAKKVLKSIAQFESQAGRLTHS